MSKKKKLFSMPSWVPWIGKQENGREVLDPSPVAMPLGTRRPERLEDQIRRLVRDERYHAAMMGDDTIEEANDFDIDEEDFNPASPFETEFDENLGREITPAEWAQNRERLMEEAKKRIRNNYRLEETFSDLEDAYKAARKRELEKNQTRLRPERSEDPKGGSEPKGAVKP